MGITNATIVNTTVTLPLWVCATTELLWIEERALKDKWATARVADRQQERGQVRRWQSSAQPQKQKIMG